jgi:outer membrane protein assembly factor BamB
MLIGLNALSPLSSAGEDPPELKEGPAFGEVGSEQSSVFGGTGADAVTADHRSLVAANWPTYRGDGRRSGYQNLPAPSKPSVAWTTRLSSPITAPVSAEEIVFVAETDRHTLYALSATDGKPAWTFVADGRIDSPPTLSSGRCLFGTRNGFVYCLRASDGALIWRFRAASRDLRLFAYEQIESAWPVHGSVLVDDNTTYFAAGRSSRIDGGIQLYALDVKTGQLLHETSVRVPGGPNANAIRQSVLPDILSIQNETVWMRSLGVDRNLAPVRDAPHLFAPRGFLDDTWWHRTYWIYGTEIGGGYSHWPDVGNAVPAGRLLVFDGGDSIYGYGRQRYRMGDGHVRPTATEDYRLFAEAFTANPVVQENPAREARQTPARRDLRWTAHLPFVAKSIVLTRDALLVAGGESLPDATQRGEAGRLWVVSRKDGAKQEECQLPGPPVLDGMAYANPGVFVSTVDGTLVCLRNESKSTAE